MEGKETAALLKELIARNTVNPPGNEFLIAEFLEKYFKKQGIHTKRFEKEKGRTNLLAWIGRGKPELMIVTHSDVVPAGSGWKTNPFKGIEKNGRIYGRGAEDNKGPLAACAVLLSVLKKHESNLKGKLSLLVAADEEKGSRLGAEFLLKENKIRADYAIVPDVGSGLREISIAEKGLLFLKAIAIGKQAHASMPEKGVNAIQRMNSFLCELMEWKIPYKKTSLFSKPTINIGTIKGGKAINIVPAQCSAGIDVRYPPNVKAREIINSIKKIAKRHSIKISIIEHQPPFLINKSMPLIESIKKNTGIVTGTKPRLSSMAGTTIAKKFVEKGIPAIGFGPGKMQAHKSNEFIEVKQLVDFAKILALVSIDMLS